MVERVDKQVYVTLEDNHRDVIEKKDKHAVCQLRIVVDNVLYCWEEVAIQVTHNGESANKKGTNVVVEVNGLDVLRGKALEGCVIRSSNNDGEYIVGCRMPQDSETIRVYVSKNYSE